MNDKAKKTVLAFDTAMGGISVGVIASNGHIVSRQMETAREQASMLVPMIQEVLDEAQIEFKDIDLLGCSVGPGSFTGLRIGLTTARVLSLSLDVPLIGLNSLEVMAHHYVTEKPILVVLETKRKDFYFQYFDTARTDLTPPFSGLAQEVIDAAPCDTFDIGGDCLSRFKSTIKGNFDTLQNLVQPDPIIMAQMSLARFEPGIDKNSVDPIYLRDADVSVSKSPPRKLAGVDRF